MSPRRGRSRLADVNLLDLRPVRTAPWCEEDGRVVVERPKPRRRGPRGWLEHVSYLTGVKRIRLDDKGSFTWLLLDGRRTVGEVCRAMRDRFGDAAEPAEERLQLFLTHLRSQDLIGYPGWDERASGGSA